MEAEEVVVIEGGDDSRGGGGGGGGSSGSRRRGGGGRRRRWCWGGADRHLSLQDGRADVVANDAGDRVTPAVVAFTESEEVRGRWGGPAGVVPRGSRSTWGSPSTSLLFRWSAWRRSRAG